MRLSTLLCAARKYRFVDPKSKKGRNIVLGQVIKFVIAWHLIGFIIYNQLKKGARKQDPDFDKKSSAQRQLTMLGKTDISDVKHYKMKGFGNIQLVNDPEKDKAST